MCHTGDKPHQCEVCDKVFVLKGHLDQHRLKHTGKRPFVCDVCGKGFTAKSDVKKHMFVHLGTKPFVCALCGKSYSRQDSLRNHERKVHTESKGCVSRLDVKQTNTSEPKLPNVKCQLIAHEHTPNGETTEKYGVAQTTKQCGNISSQNTDRSFVCETCDKAFRREGRLRVHRRKHTGDKPHWCSLCGRKFRRMRQLMSHLFIEHLFKNVN